MSNPTGTTYLQANTSYVWADGDVYEIVQTDEVEGAATGASFSGLGVDNQPHQALLNKINFIHAHQLTDEANIAALQALTGLITSDVGVNGWLRLGASDQNLGTIAIIIQWGTIPLTGYGSGNPLLPPSLTFSFPIAFPHACWLLYPYWQSNQPLETLGQNIDVNQPAISAGTPFLTQGNFIGYAIIAQQLAYPAQSRTGITGIGWVALGY
ncbi:MAG: hypothetical protein JO166_19065 [Deltaproteobacteria bacterium]|nr:hypothetical protein [Deltaproteobacteria bacterium]